MIKFRMPGQNGGAVIGLGLSDENIKRMQAGDPMYFSLADMGVEGVDIMIVTGNNEDAIVQMLRDKDMLHDEKN